MVTVPHSWILINASPGAGPNSVLDGPLSLSALTSGIKWMQWWTGKRRPAKATSTEVPHLSLSTTRVEILVEPIIKTCGYNPAEIITVKILKKVVSESGAGSTVEHCRDIIYHVPLKRLIGRIWAGVLSLFFSPLPILFHGLG